MEHYSAIKNNEFMKLAGKWIDLENIMSEVSQSQKNTHDMHSLISVFAQKLRILLRNGKNTHGRSYRDKFQSRD